ALDGLGLAGRIVVFAELALLGCIAPLAGVLVLVVIVDRRGRLVLGLHLDVEPVAEELHGLGLPLDGGGAAGARAVGVLGEQRRGRATGDDGVGDGVGVLLVAITGLAHSSFEVHAGLLLHDVRRLVGGSVEVGAGTERDARALGVGLGANRGG